MVRKAAKTMQKEFPFSLPLLLDGPKALPDCNIFAEEAEELVTQITLGGKTFPSTVTEASL